MEPDEQEPGDRIRLVDLEFIKRYSLAVRQEWVPTDELLAVLDATRDEVQAALTARQATAAPKPRGRTRRRAAADREG